MSMFATWLKEAKNIEQSTIEDAEKLAGFYNEYNEVKRTELKTLVEVKADKQDIESLRSSIMDAQTKQLESLNNVLKEQGLAIARIAQKGDEPSNVDCITKALEANKANLSKLKANDRTAGFAFKVAGAMSLAGNTTGQIPQAFRLPSVNETPQREVRFLQLLQGGSISSNLVEWVYMANEDGTAGATEEGALKKQIDFDLVVASQRVEKYTAFIKVTDEMLDDVSYIQTLINSQLSRKLLQSVELGAYSGNGTTPNLNGVHTVATAWAAGSFADAVDSANLVDVLRVGMNQIELALQPAPNYILLHPTDLLKLLMIKVTATDKRYIDALQEIASNRSLDGVPIYTSTLVTADTFLIGNTSLQYMLTKGGVNIEVGLDSDDFTKNFKTVRAEWRGVVYVMNNDRTAFVKGTISTAAAALETP